VFYKETQIAVQFINVQVRNKHITCGKHIYKQYRFLGPGTVKMLGASRLARGPTPNCRQ